jgi:Uma2 family endonuclease
MIAGGNPGSGTMTIAQHGQQPWTMGPTWNHAAVRMLLATCIISQSHSRRLAFAFLGLSVAYRDLATVLRLDISVYIWERIEREREARQHGAFTPPDSAIEIASPGQGRRALLDRCRWFVEHGSQAAILVDPRRQDLTEVRPNGVEWRLRGADVLDLGDIVDGLSIPVGELFAALSFD